MQEVVQKTANVCATQCVKYVSAARLELQQRVHTEHQEALRKVCSAMPNWCCASPPRICDASANEVVAPYAKSQRVRRSKAPTPTTPPRTPRTQTPSC